MQYDLDSKSLNQGVGEEESLNNKNRYFCLFWIPSISGKGYREIDQIYIGRNIKKGRIVCVNVCVCVCVGGGGLVERWREVLRKFDIVLYDMGY